MRNVLKNTDKILLSFSIIMLVFGLLMVFSSSNAMATAWHGQPYLYFTKQLSFILIGIVGFFIITKIPTKNYQKLSFYGLMVLILLLIYLVIFGEPIRGVKGWINIGFMTLQPSEFAKVAIIMFIGSSYEKIIIRNKTDRKSFLKPLVIAAIVIFLTLIQPDLGTSIILIGIIFFLMISIPLDPKIKEQITYISAALVLLSISTMFMAITVNNVDVSSKIDRLNFMNPCSRYQEPTGYQVCNGIIAINNGGIYGSGLGNSTQKYLYLPEAHTDFIYPVIVEEWGMIGGVLVLLAYLVILYRILLISKRSISLRGSTIAYGIAIYMFLHIAINISGALALAPLTGVPLPFLSYGGSSTLTLMIALSIVQRIEIERNLKIKENITKIVH